MKKNRVSVRFSYLLTIAICSLFFQASMFAQDDCLEGAMPTGVTNCSSVTTKTMTMMAPDVDTLTFNCQITITYNVLECELPSPGCTPYMRKVMSASIQSITWDWAACDMLTDYIMPPDYPNNFSFNPANFREFFGAVSMALSDHNFIDYYNSLSQSEKEDYQCNGTSPNCDMPDVENCPPFIFTATTPTCRDVCVLEDDAGNITYKFSDCNTSTTGCCVWKSYYCACTDEFGNIVDVNVSREGDVFQGPCGEPGIPNGCTAGPDQGSIIYYEPCLNFCQP